MTMTQTLPARVNGELELEVLMTVKTHTEVYVMEKIRSTQNVDELLKTAIQALIRESFQDGILEGLRIAKIHETEQL